MLSIINKNNYDVDQFSSLNLSENILICSPEVECDYITSNLDGSFSLKINHDDNLAGKKIFNNHNNLISVKYKPKIKITFPKGILPVFYEPNNIDFFYKIYRKFNTYQYFINEYNNLIRTDLPNVIIYQDFDLDIIIDINKYREYNTTLQLKKGQKILDFMFKFIYFPGTAKKLEIKGIYWYQHNEIYNNLLRII